MGFGSSTLKKILPGSSSNTKSNSKPEQDVFAKQLYHDLTVLEKMTATDEADKKILFYLIGLGKVIFYDDGNKYNFEALGKKHFFELTNYDIDLILTVKAIVKNLLKSKKLTSALLQRNSMSSEFQKIVKTIINFKKDDSKLGKINSSIKEKPEFQKKYAQLIWDNFFRIQLSSNDKKSKYDNKNRSKNFIIYLASLAELVSKEARVLFISTPFYTLKEKEEYKKETFQSLLKVRTAFSNVTKDHILDEVDAVNIIIMYILFERNALAEDYNELTSDKKMTRIKLLEDKSIAKVKSVFLNEEDLKPLPIHQALLVQPIVKMEMVHIQEMTGLVKDAIYVIPPCSTKIVHHVQNKSRLTLEEKLKFIKDANKLAQAIIKNYTNFSSPINLKSLSKKLSEKESFALVFSLFLYNMTKNEKNISFTSFRYTSAWIIYLIEKVIMLDDTNADSVSFEFFSIGLKKILSDISHYENDREFLESDVNLFYETFYLQKVILDSQLSKRSISLNLSLLLDHVKRVGTTNFFLDSVQIGSLKGSSFHLPGTSLEAFKSKVGFGEKIGPGFGKIYHSFVDDFAQAIIDMRCLLQSQQLQSEINPLAEKLFEFE